MTDTTTPRVAIITGASGGIGRASAVRLAVDGFAIVVHYAGNKENAEETADAVRGAGGRAVLGHGDVADEAAMADLFDLAEQEYGGVDVVVNAAGILPRGTITEMDLDTYDLVQRTNVRGTFVTGRLAAQRVRTGGAIINISSTLTRLLFPTYGAYAASKAAVEAMTRVLARELAGRDITVNAVAPGPTATPLFFDEIDQEGLDRIVSMTPMGRLGSPEDAAEVVAFLAGPSRWINGQVLFANGGLS